jgi:S1-C subfamily serine protease
VVRAFDLPGRTGALIVSVEPRSAAQQAGLHERDIIVALDGQAVASVDDLQRMLTEKPVGSQLPITVLRGTERLDLTIVPQEHQPTA